MIHCENEILDYLNIPSVPKREWDGKRGFEDGVAVTRLVSGDLAYAVATYDVELDDAPRIKKTFTLEQYVGIEKIFIVPSYMDLDVDGMDLDETSMTAAKFLVDEVVELESQDSADKQEDGLQENKNEYFFAEIHNDEEAEAYVRAYNRKHRIKGRIPRSHDGLKMKLYVIWKEEEKKKKKQ